jgi:acylglycerol lipase
MNTVVTEGSTLGQVIERTLTVPENAKAMLLIIHGLAEHRGRYSKQVEFFTAHQIACCTIDLPGHGAACATRGDMVSFTDCVNDLALLVDSLKFKHATLPLFIWGHSMGSLIATLVAAERSPKIRGVITSSVPVAAMDAVPKWRAALFKFAERIVPTQRVRLPISYAAISRDPVVVEAYKNDPLIPKSVTLRLLLGMFEASSRAIRKAKRLRMPWLALHGGADRIAPPIGSQRLIDALASTDTRLLVWHSAFHEVHNDIEPDRTVMLDAMVEWMLEKANKQ